MTSIGGSWLGATAQSDDALPERAPIARELQTAARLVPRAAEIALQLQAA